MAHTPGPWLVEQDPYCIRVSNQTGYVSEQFLTDETSSPEEALANAQLIAASPRLLAALEALCRQHPNGGALGEYDLGYPEELEEAWAAIQEATGKPFDRWAK